MRRRDERERIGACSRRRRRGGGGSWYIGGVGRDAGPVWDDSDVPPLRRLDLGLGDAGPWMGGRDGDMTDEVEDPPGRP